MPPLPLCPVPPVCEPGKVYDIAGSFVEADRISTGPGKRVIHTIRAKRVATCVLAADRSLAVFGMKQVSDQVLEMRRSAVAPSVALENA